MDAQRPGPLDGYRVVDLTRARSGPTCTRQLADLGADVIWVGHPTAGDLGRSDAHNLHRAKRSVLIDLQTEAGRDVLLALTDRADVVVENFRPGVTERLGIDQATLRGRNPRLVYGSISGFGQTGPHAERACVDQIAQGVSGLMSVTGEPGTGPWRAGIAVSDVAAGTFLTQGILAALLHRGRTGEGQWVHTSLIESLVSFMDFQATRWLIDGEVPSQAGNDHPTVFPMGTFITSDGHVNIAGALHFDRFMAALGHAELLDDQRFGDATARQANRVELTAIVSETIAGQPTEHWVEAFNAVGVPAGPVLALDETFADPQVRHLDLTATVAHPDDGDVEVLRHPVTLDGSPTSVRGAMPIPGADSRAILAELGYDEATIEQLVEGGAVRTGRAASTW